MKHFKDFGSEFTMLHTKLDADTLLDFAIHCRQNETQSPKSTRVKTMHVHSAVSGGRLMQQAFGSMTPLSSSFTEAVTTITVRELSDTPQNGSKGGVVDAVLSNGKGAQPDTQVLQWKYGVCVCVCVCEREREGGEGKGKREILCNGKGPCS
jgi:hypothetical protein